MKCINDTRICVEPKGQKLSRPNRMREGRKCCGGGGRKMLGSSQLTETLSHLPVQGWVVHGNGP